MNNLVLKIGLLFFVGFSILPSKVKADCNFKTADYIEELNTSKSIKEIRIKVLKRRKYIKNFLNTLTNDQTVINPNLKKNFKSKIEVAYEFGECKYIGRIRQHGKLRDHIRFKNGNPLRSLDVKLKNGNILNSVKFKLLIPDTRNSSNEILGNVLLKNLGIITPETFEVKVLMDNKKSVMIFQEDARKELLERNKRREGPIFEGDDSLFLLEKRFNKNLQDLSLSNLINKNWFMKGKNSQNIVFYSYPILQNTYLKYAYQLKKNKKDFILDPNDGLSNIFKEYAFALLIFKGDHGLNKPNRRFYFNSLSNQFEPIYYDGNLNLTKKLSQSHLDDIDLSLFQKYKYPHDKLLQNKNFKKRTLEKFKSKLIKFGLDEKLFFNKAFETINNNLTILQANINNKENKNLPRITNYDLINEYINSGNQKFVPQKHIKSLHIKNKNFMITYNDNKKSLVSLEELSNIINNNQYSNSRNIFLAQNLISSDKEYIKNYIPEIDADISYSKGIKFQIKKDEKHISFTQTNSDDWVTISNGKIADWTINYYGIKNYKQKNQIKQRFNNFGLTGCLNIYKTELKNTNIYVEGGGCEDSINIINSKGNIDNIYITDSFQDGIDIDFSDINIKNINVKNSGNDCLDLSFGNHYIKKGSFYNCADKALSVGEKSKFNIDNIYIDKALIGISVKDLSKALIKNSSITNASLCLEAKQKKQEFGGAKIEIVKNQCEGENFSDSNSNIRYLKI